MNHTPLSRRLNLHLLQHLRQRGVSLIETLMALAVVVVSIGTALPSFKSALENRRLDGAAAQLETDIQHARSLAVANNHSVRLKFIDDASGSCYAVFSGAANQCQCRADGSSQCSSTQAVWRSVGFDASGTVRLRSNVGSIVFDPLQGTSTPTGTLRLLGRSGQAVHLVVNIMGRVRTCSPTGLAGYKPC
jgi:type IV fimbrial biogenesis protein FimT